MCALKRESGTLKMLTFILLICLGLHASVQLKRIALAQLLCHITLIWNLYTGDFPRCIYPFYLCSKAQHPLQGKE